MKRKLQLILLLIMMFQFHQVRAQFDNMIFIDYSLKPDKTVASENVYFYYDLSDGQLIFKDNELNIERIYYIRVDDSYYDSAGLYHVILLPDTTRHMVERKTMPVNAAFSIIYTEKKGQIIGVKMATKNKIDTFLTKFGYNYLTKK